MSRRSLFARAFFLSLILAAALVMSSCVNSGGIGVGVGSTAVWGGGGMTPPIFVGGPSS